MGNLVFDGQINANGQGALQFRGVDDSGNPIVFTINGIGNSSAGAVLISGTVRGLFGSGGSGGVGSAIQFPVHQPGHGLLAGTPITETATGWVKSVNTDPLKVADAIVGAVIGPDDLIGQQFGILELLATEWDALCGTSGGLPLGHYFWVGAVDGTYTITKPSGSANYQQLGFKVLSPTVAEILLPSDAFVGGGAAGATGRITLSLSDSTQSSKYGASNKLALGSKNFDPNDTAWGLSATSTATLYMLLETNNVANVAQGDLYRETGAGSPLTIGTTATVNSLTTTLVSANVSVAFQPGAVAGVFTARCWINTPNGNDYVTCRSAWVEVTP